LFETAGGCGPAGVISDTLEDARSGLGRIYSESVVDEKNGRWLLTGKSLMETMGRLTLIREIPLDPFY
jgi:hypothetical protein